MSEPHRHSPVDLSASESWNASQDSASDPKLAPRRIGWGLYKSVRLRQWVKNLFVLAPLFFSKSWALTDKAAYGVVAALVFCLAASAVYLFNDIFDRDKDRAHPVKRLRPIASGALPVGVARTMAVGLGLVALGAALWVGPWFLAVLALYLTLNVAYSMSLKHWAFVDVSLIALGFVLRVVAGAVAIDVSISEWLLACTFFLALYLGLGKRRHEFGQMAGAQGGAGTTRKVLERYRREHLDFGVMFVGGLTVSVYTIYTLTAALPDQPLRSQHTPFSSPWLPLTIPMAVFGITRFYQLVCQDRPESPTDALLGDRPMLANLALWGLVMLALAW